MRIGFNDINDKVPSESGLYEIYTIEGIALKVGISNNLKKRLMQHATSKQSNLKIKDSSIAITPSNMCSKQSTLAKHLYFDKSLSTKHDLTTELGRQSFLADCCYLEVIFTNSKIEAREQEKILEKTGKYRYVGRVKIR